MMCSLILIYTEEGEVLYDRMGTKIVMPGPISSSDFSAPKPNEFVLRQQRQAAADNRTLVPKVTNPLTKLPKKSAPNVKTHTIDIHCNLLGRGSRYEPFDLALVHAE